MAHGVYLNHELEVEFFLLAHDDQAVENALPVLVAREIIVGDEEAAHALRHVPPYNRLDIVGCAAAGDPTLHVDDGAEAARERAAAPEIEARPVAPVAPDRLRGQHWIRHGGDARQVRQIIVDRLEGTACGVAQQGVEPRLRFAREQADP